MIQAQLQHLLYSVAGDCYCQSKLGHTLVTGPPRPFNLICLQGRRFAGVIIFQDRYTGIFLCFLSSNASVCS